MKNKLYFKKILGLLTAVAVMLTIPAESAFAAGYYTGAASEWNRLPNKLGDVSSDMLVPSYWYDKTDVDLDTILMTKEQIKAFNTASYNTPATNLDNLAARPDTFDADSIRTALANTALPGRAIYIDGVSVDLEGYFGNIKSLISTTGYTGSSIPVQYGICTYRADLKSWPIDKKAGYSAGDTDDEFQGSAMNVNEPFLVYAKCEIDGETYYWGHSNLVTGWTNAKNIAICDSKEEWLNYWQVDINQKNFLVVNTARIDLKNESDTRLLTLGTILKLASDTDIPADMQSLKSTNYIVYFASRGVDGKAIKTYGAIPKSLHVNQGFLDASQRNILDVAFECLGEEYGWGGMENHMDCSLYTRNIYRCFGYDLPRNTTWQQKVPDKFVDLSPLSDEEKIDLISKAPAGTMLYFPGHVTMFIGVDSNKNFVISDLSSAYDDAEHGFNLINNNCVNVNSLDVRRGSGLTWLRCLTGAVIPQNVLSTSCSHNMGDWIVTKLPSENSLGLKKKVCSLCGHRENQVIDYNAPEQEEVINRIESKTDKSSNDLSASISLSPMETLIKLKITAEELTMLENGKTIGSKLEVKEANKKDIPAAIQEKIQDSLAEDETVGRFLDINLFKIIDSNPSAVTETNGAIRIEITVPEDILHAGTDFYILRAHNGAITKLPLTKVSENVYYFETDRFSTYAIAYKTIENKTISEEPAAAAGTDNITVVKTGDSSPYAIYILLLGLSLCCIICGAKRKKYF